MRFFAFISFLLLVSKLDAQTASGLWYDKERSIRYQPEGTDFIIHNGKRKFVRALYGTNTGFRVEAGDLPEFALYMPGMGGNFRFGLNKGDKSKWLTEANNIKAIYRPGSMIYEIKDELLGNGSMQVVVLALADAEGMIIRTSFKNVKEQPTLYWAFGGASGKKFSRDGDIGADPESSFYLHADNCRDNVFKIENKSFHLVYGMGRVLTETERYEIQLSETQRTESSEVKNLKQLSGLFPLHAELMLAEALKQAGPVELFNTSAKDAPVLTGRMKVENKENYFLIQNPVGAAVPKNEQLATVFAKAEGARVALAGRMKLNTPDRYLNTLGGALSIAAEAIWEDPSYLHGAVAWRMRLNAWRGAYVADPMGWHDRARKHFSSYALSQVKTPPVTGVVMDTALNLARHQEKIGTFLFSDGYICRNPNGDIRAHHYDMNLVFVDQLLNHFNWTGDTNYVREMWPLIKRHLAWEKRNFDSDDDGLYDAYAAIWASDALQYSGGGVTHSSAYNYRSNRMAAQLAKLIGEDGTMYEKEAERIYEAVQKNLWLPEQGAYAEYKDLLGKQLVHPSPGVWTIYHAIDSRVPNSFQSWLNLRYIDKEIPHIPVRAKGFYDTSLFLLSTSNWQPYTWSINNVAFAENLHTALSYWQGNRSEEAFRLWRSAIIESMYMSASPGGFQQLSFYDAIRGELYRDFADGIGVAARTVVEGLFGIQPDLLHDSLTIQPGIPASWNFANLSLPHISFDFKREGTEDAYLIKPSLRKNVHLKLILHARNEMVEQVTINGKPAKWRMVDHAVGAPQLLILAPKSKDYRVMIKWKGAAIRNQIPRATLSKSGDLKFALPRLAILEMSDPQQAFSRLYVNNNMIAGAAQHWTGEKTIFARVRQGSFSWWQPVFMQANAASSSTWIVSGTSSNYETIDISPYFNDKLTNIFKHQYLSPRPKGPTLQLPTQGIGNWCYPLIMANIDDSGLRRQATATGIITTSENKIPFRSPGDSNSQNIVFASQWDNFPDSVVIPLSGRALTAHLLMTGTTNPMQSRLVNGMVTIRYTDGSVDTLLLRNPENWWPIEQDYFEDGYAFATGAARPERLYLKEGRFAKGLKNYSSIRGYSNRAIDGGAASVLYMPLDHQRNLRSLVVHALANDVVIGLMSVTLSR